MKDFLRSKQGVLVILTAGVTVFGLVIWLLFGGSPTRTPKPEGPVKIPNLTLETINEGVVTFENIEIKGELPSVPPEMEVYLRVNQITDGLSIAEVGTRFGFSTAPQLNESAQIYEWSEDGKIMTFNLRTGGLIYSKEAKPLANFDSNQSSEIVRVGQEFVRSKGLGESQSTGVSWVKMGGGEAELVNGFNQANAGVVGLENSLNGYKVYSQSGQPLSQSVWVGSDNQVIKASLLMEKLVGSQKTVEVIPVSQVIGELTQGGGKIVSINGQTLTDHNNFVRLEVEKFEIGYFWDLKSVVLQPIYIVKGRGYGVNDTTGADLVIYLQAIKR